MNDRHSTEPKSSTAASGEFPTVERVWGRDDRPSSAVIESVSAVTNRDPLELPPLQRFVETDALDSLLISAAERGRDDVEVSFRYAELQVTLGSDGHVELDRP